MHIVTTFVLTIGALAFLVLGLVRVLHDLLERGPYDAPLVEESPRQDDSARWPVDGDPGQNQICR
jgi:hypothetical protein